MWFLSPKTGRLRCYAVWLYLITWNLKHLFINGCFIWMIPNYYIKNGCFNKHPFKTACLGYQALNQLFPKSSDSPLIRPIETSFDCWADDDFSRQCRSIRYRHGCSTLLEKHLSSPKEVIERYKLSKLLGLPFRSSASFSCLKIQNATKHSLQKNI